MLKKSILVLVLFSSILTNAQTNTFPTSGNVGIGTLEPKEKLQINDDFVFHTGGHNVLFFNHSSAAGDLDPNLYSGDLRFDPVNGGLSLGVSSTTTNAPSSQLYINKNGSVGIGTTSLLGRLHINGETYVTNGWLRVKGQRGIYFHDYGGGFYMKDNSWIRTFGNKNFYHNTGVMRTDGVLQVGGNGARFIVDGYGKVGIGVTNPKERLEIGKAFTFHDGGHQVLFFNHSSAKGDHFDTKYSADLRFDSLNGIMSLGVSSTKTNAPSTRLAIRKSGNVGIGTTTPDSKLTVKGKIHAEEVKIDLSVPAPDYVFKKEYDLLTIDEVQQHIQEKGHLPNIPSAKIMETEGVDLGTMNMKLLEKIEELTLYTIDQEEELKIQEKQLKSQEKRIKILEEKLELLLKNK